MNKAYEFISYPYESFSLVPKTTSTLTIHDQDINLDDMLLEFTKFIRAAGYVIDSDQYLSIVSDEELEDYEEDVNESWWRFAEEFGMDFHALKHSVGDWTPAAKNSLQDVTRVEVIDEKGRSYVNTDASDVVVHLQDEGRTLKVFVQ